jgi:hypothetical protein
MDLPSERTSALNDSEKHDDNGHHEENVDEAPERVRRDDSEEPQDEEER